MKILVEEDEGQAIPRLVSETFIDSINYNVTLIDVWGGIKFVTETGEVLHLHMRDGGFEVSYLAPESTRSRRLIMKHGKLDYP